MPRPESLSQLFETACRWGGEGDRFTDPARRLTGPAAAAAARRSTAQLDALGLGPGGVAAFLCGPSTDHFVAVFGVLGAGGVFCALHVRETDARLALALAELRPAILIADPEELERARRVARQAGLTCPVVATPEVAGNGGGRELAPRPVAPGALAAILLSSGTTGTPKQVMHSHESLAATAMTAGPVYGALGPRDGVAVPMPPSFAAWVHVVLPFLALRGRIAFLPRMEVESYLDVMEAERLTVAALVPTLWRAVLPALDRRALPALRVAMFSGEPGTPDLVAALCGRFPAVRGVYLGSEGGCAAGIVATEADLDAPGMAGAAGRPVPGADLRVVDPEAEGLVDLPPGETGEIAVTGASLSIGYRGDTDLTARRFPGGWWRTGDLGRIGPGGLVQIAGRLDNRINSGGVKVHAEEIEAAILRLPQVRAAAVVGHPDPQWGERIEAHVILADPDCDADTLARAFADACPLPRALHPKRFHIHDTLPTGPTGKLYRRALREQRS